MLGENDQEILHELQRMNKLLAVIAIAGRTQSDKIGILASAGFNSIEIGETLGMTANAVRVALHSQRKKSKKVKSK